MGIEGSSNIRHFWAKAKENLFTCKQEKERILKRLSRESIDTLLLKKKKKKITEILYKIRKKLASNKQKFQEIFEEHDHQANGIVSCYTFSYLLESIFELDPTEVSLLIQLVNGGRKYFILISR
jgi:translation initiation factor 2B subunit (eIF-2B alpha/beta/delta family)